MSEVLVGLLWVFLYALFCLSAYQFLRGWDWRRGDCLALSVPLAQATISFIFQVRFLSGSMIPLAFLLPALAFGVGFVLFRWRTPATLWTEAQALLATMRTFKVTSILLGLAGVYFFAQAVFLFPENYDSLVYHFPRVVLFHQQGSFFLDSATRYHQVIFPVGADVLFYPFIVVGSATGLGIFSLSSYFAIGAGIYAVVSRLFTARAGTATALVVLAMPELVFQATSTKNDIVMAGVFLGTMVLLARLGERLDIRAIVLLGGLLAFGVSTKTLFVALVPGLFLLAVFQLGLWKKERLAELFKVLNQGRRPLLVLLFPVLVFSQVWLFVWNIQNYGGWSGPEEFTERHVNHDGVAGAVANASRYFFQTLHIDQITNQSIWEATGIPPSVYLASFYDVTAGEIFGKKGNERSAFRIYWANHEAFAWFGPLGALALFICLPCALIARPRLIPWLLPVLVYFAVVCYKVSWMPWNGRFMTPLFAGLCPAIGFGISQSSVHFSRLIQAVAASFLFLALVTNLEKPLWPRPPPNEPAGFFAVGDHANVWASAASGNRGYFFDWSWLDEFFTPIPEASRVAVIVRGHDIVYPYMHARPDIRWIPMNIVPGHPKLSPAKAFNTFLKTEIDYLLTVGLSLDSPAVEKLADNELAHAMLLRRKISPDSKASTSADAPDRRP